MPQIVAVRSYRLKRALLGAAAVVTLSATAACSADASPSGVAERDGASDPGIAHVHGLGIDPSDGVLYAATHFGLFRLPETGPASRVAERFQDTMGFTVVGPRTFLGSGHPDQQKDPQLPVRLGLIRSTDAAETWQSVSLSGKVDFHALHALGTTVYGWDSGSGDLMRSTDGGASFQTRSRLGLRDFAIDPRDSQSLLATTERGLLQSRDGGRTWQDVRGAPQLAVLAWPRDGLLYGVDLGGALSRSADAGRTWSSLGSAGGQPEALTVDARSGNVYVAVTDRGVLASNDGGTSFTTRYAA